MDERPERIPAKPATAVLDGEGAECTLNGLYLASGKQHIDNHTAIDHAKPHCNSHELYKGILAGKSRLLFAPKKKDGGRDSQTVTANPTATRKIYLDTHRRYYLVVCELHCDAPGFPTTSFDQVCQAGFVVRRTWLKYPESAKGEAALLLKESASLVRKLAAAVPSWLMVEGRSLRLMMSISSSHSSGSKKLSAV